jgi:D-alanyl-D-alanine carboxypeptidase
VGAPITGLAAADAHITELAVKRGYRPRPVARESTLLKEGTSFTHGSALAAFHALQQAARAQGIELGIVSAYRSLDNQRTIWTNRFAERAQELRKRSISPEQIASGQADDVVDLVLSRNAIPGYSKHHTGYAMDLDDRTSGKYFTDFDQTSAHRWLSADNYLNAKRFGFLPSYPPGASNQGPDPEPWEYVYVGEELLREEW